jgi:hypothetical protein
MTHEEGWRILREIRRIKPFIQASLSLTKKRCGNPKCRCAQGLPIHETAVLTWKEGQRTHTLYVPVELREEVTRWVEEGKRLKALIAQMSEAQRTFLVSKRTARRRSTRS